MNNNTQTEKLTCRYLARIVLEASTPLFVASGRQSTLSEALVQRDAYGFPMIPGTSLMGVLRHALFDAKEEWASFFGFHENDQGEGSRLKTSAAYLVLKEGKIAEGYAQEDWSEYLPYFENLPLRQHVRINHRGVANADEGGLFTNEIVYQGCRFKFELELKSDGSEADEKKWQALLAQLNHSSFRIGQGTRNGYGALEVYQCRWRKFDLELPKDFDDYLSFDPSLNALDQEETLLACREIEKGERSRGIHYRLKLQPDHYFHFGGGARGEEVVHTPVEEWVMRYSTADSLLSPLKRHFVPASSIKGALRHRTCFYYNQAKECWAEDINEEAFREKVTGTKNTAVYSIFGAEQDFEVETEKGKEKRKKKRGHLIIDDQYFDPSVPDKIFNHVAIDRFTGGASDGALFSEKASRTESLDIEVYLEQSEFADPKIIIALENALYDICRGLLPLGGMTTKGHGIFTGELFKNDIPHIPDATKN